MKTFLVIISVFCLGLAAWAFTRWEDAYSRLEACAIEELRMRGDREFLISLFELSQRVKSRAELFDNTKRATVFVAPRVLHASINGDTLKSPNLSFFLENMPLNRLST